MIGKTLSHYKVLEKIGQGGMGEVYRAEDTNLSRDVAIKVLPEQFTKDPQRLARFEREAKLLAQLNHPNIAAIYGFEKAEGVHFLALELVPGETLQERIAKGPVPVEEALEICRQIAEGVEAAHEKGVIHRDLKPANVKVTPEGKVKILDFGLAKAFEAETPVTDISQSPTLTEEMTRAGVILGTAAYMSPEQAKGKPVDKRADVFAFGAVLYELLTGKRAFEGETITETIAAVLKSDPDWEALPVTTPWRIKELLRRCLTKDVHDRLRDIANVRIEIRLALSEPATVLPIGSGAAQPLLWRRIIPWSIAVAAVVMAISIAFWRSPQPISPPSTRFAITPSLAALENTSGNDLAISADGRNILYKANTERGIQLYLHSLDDLADRPIPGTEGVQGLPFFSPNGESVGFFTQGSMKKISLRGGSPITLYDAGTLVSGSGSWGLDDTIVFSPAFVGGAGLYRVSASGGEAEILATPDRDKGESGYFAPYILPGGKVIIFTVSVNTNEYQIAALSLETGEQEILIERGRQGKVVETGHLIFEQSGTLMAASFDLSTLEVTSGAVPVLQGVRQNTVLGNVDYAVSDEGTLVYVPDSGERKTLVWVDREGQEERLVAEPREYLDPRISPDGSRLAIVVNDSGGGDVWIYDLEREIPTRLTFDPALDHMPVWTPDGQRVVFDSTRDGPAHNLYWKAADGTADVERLTTSLNNHGAYSFSPDGKSLVHSEIETSGDLHVLSMEDERISQPLLHGQFTEQHGAISPSGRWIAYESNESGRYEIYVRPFPKVGEGKWQISSGGGEDPVWAPQGQELFYRNGQALMAVGIKTEPTFTPGRPVVLFTGDYQSIPYNRQYDVTPDGRRFLMIKQERTGIAQINVVLNWFEELKRLVPTP